ncbi:MAG TPA: SDR family oxidoreductase [Acidimicrobiia bacterium]
MSRALVTGASAGIGCAFATALAARGDDLVLVARDAVRLADLAGALERAHGVTAETLAADLLTDDGIAATTTRLGDVARPVDLLVNNAGMGTYGEFADAEITREVDEIQLNVLAVVRLTHAALGAMQPRRRGTIVNVSSLAAYQPSPNSATYSATKAFINSFTQAVREEAKQHGVQVMVLCPGYTHTEFHERAGLKPSTLPEFAWQHVDQVVTAALRDLDRNRAVCIPGALNQVAAALSSVTPAGITRRLAGAVVKRT